MNDPAPVCAWCDEPEKPRRALFAHDFGLAHRACATERAATWRTVKPPKPRSGGKCPPPRKPRR